jgi:hypothetical protein
LEKASQLTQLDDEDDGEMEVESKVEESTVETAKLEDEEVETLELSEEEDMQVEDDAADASVPGTDTAGDGPDESCGAAAITVIDDELVPLSSAFSDDEPVNLSAPATEQPVAAQQPDAAAPALGSVDGIDAPEPLATDPLQIAPSLDAASEPEEHVEDETPTLPLDVDTHTLSDNE